MYVQNIKGQLCLPTDLGENIPANHLVDVMNAAVKRFKEALFNTVTPGEDGIATPVLASLRGCSKNYFWDSLIISL